MWPSLFSSIVCSPLCSEDEWVGKKMCQCCRDDSLWYQSVPGFYSGVSVLCLPVRAGPGSALHIQQGFKA